MPPRRRSRAFRITWFLGTLTWLAIFATLDTVQCEYMIYQEEICPDTGRRHVQAYVYFANGKTLERVRAIFQGADIRLATKSPKINKDYCTKLESRREGGRARERGTLPDQGARNDIHDARMDIENGMDDFNMFVKWGMLWARYSRVLIAHRSAMVAPRDFWTITLTLWGNTGIGKSARAWWNARQNGGNIATMLLPRNQDSMVWGDGCIDARTIIIEDMELPGNFSYGVLKNMLDWTPCLMPVKGMSMQWAPHFVIITSNHHPRKWYPEKTGSGHQTLTRYADASPLTAARSFTWNVAGGSPRLVYLALAHLCS
ncbi:replication protein, partial [uncultured marine virus]